MKELANFSPVFLFSDVLCQCLGNFNKEHRNVSFKNLVTFLWKQWNRRVNATFASWDVTLKFASISALKMCAEKHWYRKEKFPYFRHMGKWNSAMVYSITNLKPHFFFHFPLSLSISAIEK